MSGSEILKGARQALRKLKLNKDVKLSYVTDKYDGILSGYCWYNGKYCAFGMKDEVRYKYKLTEKEIEETKAEFAKYPNLTFSEDDEWDYTSYRIFNIYNFETDLDAVIALGNRAIWEDFVGFQNSHNGMGTAPRIQDHNTKRSIENDYVFEKAILKTFSYKNYFNLIPYRDIRPKINKNIIIGTFELYNETKELKKKGYKLVQLD